jgi:uncharacterized protein (DUF1800 family)
VAVPTYQGPFGPAQAQRLLWRAGFGGTRAAAAKLAAKGLGPAVRSLTRPPKLRLRGPNPKDDGDPIAPLDAWGHDHLHWLDRMVRTNQPCVERMALIWHDWFATGDVSSQRLSLNQAKLFRRHALGSFSELLLEVTKNPAMLVWLSGIYNERHAPNENYGRELMELFTLGASNEAGYPYSEDDVREQARALTGWTARWKENVGYVDFRFEAGRHDPGTKTILGKSGNFGWRDSCRLCLRHDAHAPYFVRRLWAQFIPEPPNPETQAALVDLYVDRGYAIRPVVEAILRHPHLYEGPSLVKAPVIYIAGLLRLRARPIDTNAWTWIADMAGQRLFRPPNVSGWDESRWLDTSSFRGRWYAVAQLMRNGQVSTDGYDGNETSEEAIEKALRFWGRPQISTATRAALDDFCGDVEAAITAGWQRSQYRALRQNALRHLIATSPEMQAS